MHDVMQYDPIQDFFQRGFVILGLGLATVNMPTKFELSISAHYEDIKRGSEFGNWVVGSHSRSLKITPFDRAHRVPISLP